MRTKQGKMKSYFVQRKTLSSLGINERKAIENDLLKTKDGFATIANRHNIFERDVKIIAVDLGLIDKSEVPGYKPISTQVLEPIIPDAKTNSKSEVKKIKRKHRTELTDELKFQIAEELEDYQKKGWIGYSSEAIAKKYNISLASLTRISTEYHIVRPKVWELKKLISMTVDAAEKAAVIQEDPIDELKEAAAVAVAKEEEDFALSLHFDKAVDTDIKPLADYISSKVISVKLDASVMIQGINYQIYDKPINKMKVSADYNFPIEDFFNRVVAGKGILEVKIYAPGNDLNFQISSLLTKYCYIHRCNLTYVILGKESKIITDFNNENINSNIDWLVSKHTINKYLYKMNYEKLISLDKAYFLNLSYQGKNKIIVCSSYEYVVELFSHYILEANLDGKIKFNGSIKLLENGIPIELLNFTNAKIYI